MNRKMTILLLSVLMIPVWGFAPAGAEDLTGRQIVEEQQNRHVADNEMAKVALTLIDRKGKEKHQEMVIYTSKKEGKTRSLIQYHAPANIRGVGLLTWEQGEDQDDDQWMYMSASKATKRIAGGSKKNQFMGTDMAFEDMRPENLDTHEYTLKGEEAVDANPCWKIEAVPSTDREKEESGYGKRIMWVDKAHYFTLKVEYFDHHDRHIKTALFEEIKPMGGQLFRSFKVTWKRLSQKTSTIMDYQDIDLETRHTDMMFTKNYMTRPIR